MAAWRWRMSAWTWRLTSRDCGTPALCCSPGDGVRRDEGEGDDPQRDDDRGQRSTHDLGLLLAGV